MSDGTIKIPTWALPIGAAALSGAMVWGASQAQAQATQEEVDRIEAAVVDVVEEAASNGKVSSSKCEQNRGYRRFISGTVGDSQGIDAKLQQLIEIMLKQN
jgi:hypothetical protein